MLPIQLEQRGMSARAWLSATPTADDVMAELPPTWHTASADRGPAQHQDGLAAAPQIAWRMRSAFARVVLALTVAALLCSSGTVQGTFAGALLSITPTAEELKAELLARSMRPPQPSGLPSIRTGQLAQRSASDAQTALPFSPAEQERQAQMAFPQAVSCPPEFWGELFC